MYMSEVESVLSDPHQIEHVLLFNTRAIQHHNFSDASGLFWGTIKAFWHRELVAQYIETIGRGTSILRYEELEAGLRA